MKNIFALLLSLFLIGSAHAEIGMSPAGGGTGGGGTPGGISGQLQFNNSGSFGGLPNTAGSYTAANYSALGSVSSGLIIDPRNYGATCSGAWYSIQSPTLNAGGSGYNPGDNFIVEASGTSPYFGNHMRGGKVATGHVLTTGAGGAVATFSIDYAGTGYYAGVEATFATSGTGTGFQISYSVNSTPSMPTTSLASGGNNWAAGDTFYIPNSTSGNYMTGRVSTVSAGVVTAYTINNAGGDYTVNATAPAYALGGLGTGLVINVSSVTGNASNGTWDDTFGLMNASVASSNSGGSILEPDQCWVQNMMPFDGSTFYTPNIAPNYGYSDLEVSGELVYVSSPTHMFIYGSPSFGVDFNGQSALSFSGFEVRSYSGGVGTCIGSAHGGGLVDTSGIVTPAIRLSHMSAKGCGTGLGNNAGTGSYITLFSYQGDYGANGNGIYGPFSDSVFDEDIVASAGTGIWFSVSAGGLERIIAPRLEYLSAYGIRLDSGGIQTQIIGAQTDRTTLAAIYVNNANQVTVTGGTYKGAGEAGSLKVTGAANNGSGLIRLTVTGYGSNPNGGNSATSGLVTGDKVSVANVTGTTEANGNWTLTVIDGSHIDLQSSTFTNAYVSGGLAGVWNKSSYLLVTGSAGYDFHVDNATFAGYSAGAVIPPSFVLDAKGSTSFFDHISITEGSAKQATSGNASGYMQAFANWQTTPPANYQFDVPNNAPCRTDNTYFSINCATGSVGLGTATPNSLAALDMSAWTSAFILPTGTTGQQPTPTAGMCRYNSTTPGIECYYSSGWQSLGSVGWPTSGDVVISNGTNTPAGVAPINGDCLVGVAGAWAADPCTGTVDTNSLYRDVSFTFDGGGSALTAGKIIYLSNIPYTGTITGWTIIADQSCSATVDIWKTTYAGAPPTVANTIVGSDIPTLSSVQKNRDTTLTGWGSTAITAADVVAAKLATSATCQFVNVTLQVTAN